MQNVQEDKLVGTILIFCHFCNCPTALALLALVAGVGWLSWTAAESLRAFVERVFANFRDKWLFFTLQKNMSFVGVQILAQTQARSLKYPYGLPYVMLVLQKLSDSRLYERSLKAPQILSKSCLKTLCKSSKSSWKLFESRLSWSSPEQANFC